MELTEAREKKKIDIVSSYAMCSLTLFMPFRIRIIFTFLLNFIYNHVLVTLSVIASVINKFVVQVLIFILYFVIIGIYSLVSRLMGKNYIQQERKLSSYFFDKEKPDETQGRFERQY